MVQFTCICKISPQFYFFVFICKIPPQFQMAANCLSSKGKSYVWLLVNLSLSFAYPTCVLYLSASCWITPPAVDTQCPFTSQTNQKGVEWALSILKQIHAGHLQSGSFPPMWSPHPLLPAFILAHNTSHCNSLQEGLLHWDKSLSRKKTGS